MTQRPSVTAAARPRRRSIWAVFALVGALVAAGAAAPANAEGAGSGPGTISGYVTGDGAPLAGVSVSIFGADQGADALTDENGFYEVTDLASGDWTVFASPGDQYQSLDAVDAVLTEGAPNATVDLAFVSYPSGTSTVSGVLTNRSTGDPIAGVNLYLSGSDVPQNQSASTNEAGEFSFNLLPAGTFFVSYSADGYVEFNEDITVGDNESVVANRTLVPKDSAISGHLRLANGTPVADTWVNAQSVDGFSYGGGISDANGDYVITDLGALDYVVSVGGIGTLYNHQEKPATASADATVTVNFKVVPRKTGSLAGTVLQPGGDYYTKPVCATLYSSKSKKAVAEQYIDGDHYGSDDFLFADLKPGQYTVEVRDCDDDPTTKFHKVFLGGVKNYKDATFVTIAAAQDSSGNDIEVAPRAH